MIRSKPKVGALGLCVLAVGVMAFGTSAAQAAPPEWMVAGKNINSTENTNLEPAAGIEKLEMENSKKEIEEGISLLVKVGTTHIEILCTKASLINLKLLTEGKSTEGNITFSGCSTFLNGTKSAVCMPSSAAGKGTIVTEKGRRLIGLLVLGDGTKHKVLFIHSSVKNGKGEELFAKFTLGEECALGENVEVTGVLNAIDANGKQEVEEVTHLIVEGPGSSLKALNNPAKLVGGMIMKLTGAHEGLKWSGLWP